MDKLPKFVNDISDFIFMEDTPEESDIILIPGGSYPEIAERAAELYHEGYAPYVLPSGRFSIKVGRFCGPAVKAGAYNGDYTTEWEFLADVLMRNGVPEHAVLREDESTFTKENAVFSKRLTDSLGLRVKKAILCCKSYHARRAFMCYQTEFEDTEFFVCPADVKGIDKRNWMRSEAGISMVMGELQKCGGQFQDAIQKLFL
ncbi:MAG: YdcF family protein [Oscillospiraceae bacterium]|jgi:uncharacterized SAM-binding protein YcdF (DUF218 family)|nr:YdcF family protein [Oscillospiraceae bacterium]